jgi:predicted metalloprotease with PDZ domain
MLMTPDIVKIPWQNMVIYPAGWYARDITVQASLRLPANFQLASALELAGPDGGRPAVFMPTSLETLVDSPVYAGRYFQRCDLAPGASIPIRLSVFADSAEDLAVSPEELVRMRAMVDETERLFESSHYKHYDLLISFPRMSTFIRGMASPGNRRTCGLRI